MTTYLLPQDDNANLNTGLLVPGQGLFTPAGIFLLSDGAKSYATTLVYPAGAPLAQNPVTTTITNALDTAITFATTPYHRVMLQNNMSATILYFAFDTPAGPGTFTLQPGQFFEYDTGSVVHLYQASGSSVNLNSTGGIALQAW